MSPVNDFSSATMPTTDPSQIRRIQRLLIASSILSIVSFGFSMVLFAGFLSFFITPSAAAASIIFDATLLALSVKEQRAEAATGDQGPEAGSPDAAMGANQSKHLRSRQLSATLRKPSIFVAIGLAMAWLGASCCLLYFLAAFWTLELEQSENYKVFAPILEVIFNISHAAVLGSYAVKSWFERKRLLGPIEIPSSSSYELRLPNTSTAQGEVGIQAPAPKDG